MIHNVVRKTGESKKSDRFFGRNHNRIMSGSLAAIALSISFVDVALAQRPEVPERVVAIEDDAGDLQISWANDEVDFYIIRLGSNYNKQYLCNDVDLTQYSWLNCNSTIDFEKEGSRLSYSAGSTNWVQIRAIRDKRYSDWGLRTDVSDGLPRNLQIERFGNRLEVDWDQNPETVNEPVDKYVVWTRPIGWSNNGVRNADGGDGTSNTIAMSDLPASQRDRPTEVKIRAEYENLGKTVQSDWIAETELANVAPLAVGPVTGDLTDQCRPRPNPDADNPTVYERIGAVGEYAEDRIPLEAHVWFFPTADSQGNTATGLNLGHAHLLTCVPHTTLGSGSVVRSQTLPLDIEIQAHLTTAKKLDGTNLDAADRIRVEIDEIEIRGRNGSGSDILIDRLDFNFDDCFSGENCRHSQRVNVQLYNSNDAPGFHQNGIKELRIAARHNIFRENGNQQFAEVRGILRSPFELNVQGQGRTTNTDFTTTITESSGWLIERPNPGAGGYATIGLNKFGLNFNSEKGAVPVAQISRNDKLQFKLRLEADPCRNLCDEDNMPLSKLWAFVDPRIHTDHSAHGGHDGQGDETNTICPRDNTNDSCLVFVKDLPADKQEHFETVNVDISDLESGHHQIMFAVEQPMIDTQGEPAIKDDFESTLTGLLIVRFIVTD